jgi:hypothetical protein
VSVDAASAACCCEGFTIDEVCDLWAECDAPSTLTVSVSIVRTDVVAFPDGTTWEAFGFQPNVPIPDTHSVSLSGTLTRGADGVYRGTLTGSATGGGEFAEYLQDSVTVVYPQGFTPGECDYGMPWYPDCDKVCTVIKRGEVRYQGSLSVEAQIRCQPWFLGGSAWDVGSGLWLVAASGDGTVTTSYRCTDFGQTNPSTEPWDASSIVPLQPTQGNPSPLVDSRGCPPGTDWRSISTSETLVLLQHAVYAAFLVENPNPPFFEIICETDPTSALTECGDVVRTVTYDLVVSVA